MTITWEQILAFLCEDQSMAVTSLLFIAFLWQWRWHYLLPRGLRPYFLLAASYGFSAMTVNRPLVGAAGATAVSWLCGLIIGSRKAKPVRVLGAAGDGKVVRRAGILVYYKYWNIRYLRRQHPQSPGQSAGTLGVKLLHLCGDELHHRCV